MAVRVNGDGIAELGYTVERGEVTESGSVEVITGEPEAPKSESVLADKFWKISGVEVKLIPSQVIDGKQCVFRLPPKKATTAGVTPKDEGPDANTKSTSGTPTNENGSHDQSSGQENDTGIDGIEEFYYCYDCKDTWELDDDDFLDFSCPYCGKQQITIVEMSENEVRDLADDWSFFHM